MTKKNTSAWSCFLEKVESTMFSIGRKGNEEFFFRGHTNTGHMLLPGLYRDLAKTKGRITKKIPDDLWNTESDLFYEFRAKARSLHLQQLSDWDILFFMQHHGVRTRLLDWSDSLGVALYFALLKYTPDCTPCIWIMNPYKFNEKCHGSRDLWDPQLLNYYEDYDLEGGGYADLMLYSNTGDIFPWDKPVALYPMRKADRLSTQNGYFTIHGNDSRPIEKILKSDPLVLQKIELPKEAIGDAFKFLQHAGINHFSMFPDLDGLSRYLNQQYFI